MKRILGKFAAAVMVVAMACSAGFHSSVRVTDAQGSPSGDFDCAYGINDKTDPFLVNTYGAKEIVTYTEEEATAAGVPAGFTGDVLSVEHTSVNRGIVLDFSSRNVPIQLVESISFRVYIGDDGNPNDGYPELRIPAPIQKDVWVMRYPFADKTGAWHDVVLQEGNGSFLQNKNFSSLAKDGYLYKLELSMRHNGKQAAFYIDSINIKYIDNDGVAPVLTYNGEDVVTISHGQQLNFDVSAVDALEGKMDVEYVWGDPSKLDADGKPTPGTHTLTFVSRDFYGNTAEKTITIIVDEPDVTPPTLPVPVDTIYAKVGAHCMLTFTATDDKSAVEIKTEWSDGALDRYERLTAGTHTLTVIATDLSGNQTRKTITFIVTVEGDTSDVIIDEEKLCNPPINPNPDEPTPDEPTPDEPTPDEPTPDEPNPDEPTPDEPTPDEPTPDEPNPDEPNPDEPNPDEPNPDEPNPDEPTPDDPTPDDPNPTKTGCGSSLSVVAGLPLLVLCACGSFKRKED